MALQQLFEMYRGDDYTIKLTFTDEFDVPIDVTGWVLKASLKISPEMEDDADHVVTVDLAALTGTDATNGIAYITFPHEQTKDMVSCTYYIDVQKEYLGAVVTVLMGTITVKSDVTKRTA
jgi:hypothetical protein